MMTQSELAEIIRDAFDGVIWQKTGNFEPMGVTTTQKFEHALRKQGWRKHNELGGPETEDIAAMRAEYEVRSLD